MSSQESSSDAGAVGLTPAEIFADFGERVRKGYDPVVVDAHLEHIARGVADLRSRLESGGGDDESLELVLRATRRSVDEALTEARAKADRIVVDAEAHAAVASREGEDRAARIVREAEERAVQVVADAEERARALDRETAERKRVVDDEVRDRYSEIGRLLEVREVELEALDAEIERRQESLRIASADLMRLADGFIDLRTPTTDHGTTVPETDLPSSSLPAPESVPTEP